MRLGIVMIILALACSALRAQRTAVCTIKNFQRTSGVYSFEVWGLRSNLTGSIPVGTSQFFFDYNSNALTTPSLSDVNLKYTGPADSTGDYLPMRVERVAGKVVVSILFVGNNLGTGQALSTAQPDGEHICSVSLTIIRPDSNANLRWDVVNSAFTTTNLQNVSHIFVGEDENPLPIQLLNFTATPLPSGVRLDWMTLSERNNYGFEVQRRPDTTEAFQTIPNSFIPGHGTTNEPHTYTFIDSTPAPGQSWYRLRQIDLDGTVSLSEPITVSTVTSVGVSYEPTEFRLSQNYPNPFNPTTRIAFSLPSRGASNSERRERGRSHVTLTVYDLIGRAIATLVNEQMEPGNYERVFDAGSLAGGVYLYRLSSGSFMGVKKMVLLR